MHYNSKKSDILEKEWKTEQFNIFEQMIFNNYIENKHFELIKKNYSLKNHKNLKKNRVT